MSEWTGQSAPGVRSPRFPSSKFAVPRAGARLVHRSRLLDRLDQGQHARLTLVVGSPGAGKTALLADWLAARPQRPAAWLSSDSADADPVRFVAAVIEALRRAGGRPDIGEDARQLLSLDGQVSADVIAALADDLERLDGLAVLVIDDFHLIGETGAAAAALLVEYWPESVQLVLTSRTDPPFRLQRMRANQELVELRDRDLSFSPEETSRFLSGFGLRLREEELATVHQRSEGWVAGLQMAAISIQHAPDADLAAGRLELRRHTVAGYFLDEVLYRQPPQVVEFMLATSILDELSPGACTALCGPGSATVLEEIYRAHLFVTMVDAQVGTYRYHQLIKEVLRSELHARDPDREQRLQVIAADYLAEVGQVGPAARHLLAAGETAAAFSLLSERVVRDYTVNPTLGSALDLDEIQPDLFADAPEILVPLAADLLFRGAFERGARTFALAQQTVVDPDRQPELAVQLAFLRALYFALVGHLDVSLAHRVQAYQLGSSHHVGQSDWFAAADVVAMQCHLYLEEFSQARRLADRVTSAQLGLAVTEVLCAGVIGQAVLAEGGLVEAQALTDRALAAARQLGFERHYFAFAPLRTAALLALERHDLARAAEFTERALGLLGGGRPAFDYLAQLDRAQIWAAGHNLDEALSSLPAARLALRSEGAVVLARADELEARLRLALGDRRGAHDVAERLPENRRRIVSCVIALAVGNPKQAADALGDGPARPTTIRGDLEQRLLRASIAIAQSSPGAPQLVRDVLAMIDRHGFLQTVLDTAPSLVDYLVTEAGRYPRTDTLAALIAARLETRHLSMPSSSTKRLPDPLTDAEVRVLQALPRRLTYADMATELHLSLNTVKTHLRHTYMKLGVTSRSAAVKKSSMLGLL